MSEAAYHIPVLLRETIEGLNIRENGVYVDCTFGGGGHARAILEKLGPEGRLYAFDQDPDAERNLPGDKRLVWVPHNFRHIGRFLRLYQVESVNGILADLGVSSHQFNEGDRGFSTRFDADLDMRMDSRQAKTAADLLQEYSETALHKLFERYGEVTNAKTLARTIVQARKTQSLKTIANFQSVVAPVVKGNPNKYFAQVFQALRIEVNDELGALKELLQQSPSLLATGGRMAVISFHSLEDRLVKHFFRHGRFDEVPDDPFTARAPSTPFVVITKKPIVPSDAEAKANPRSRSAKLRIAEKK